MDIGALIKDWTEFLNLNKNIRQLNITLPNTYVLKMSVDKAGSISVETTVWPEITHKFPDELADASVYTKFRK